MAKFKVFYQVEAQHEIEVEVEAASWLEAQRKVNELGESEEWRAEQLKAAQCSESLGSQEAIA